MTIVMDIEGRTKLISLGSLSFEEGEAFQKEFDRQLLLWRHHRKHLDSQIFDALDDTCVKLSPNHQVVRSKDGYRLIPKRVSSYSIMSGQTFKGLSFGEGAWLDTTFVRENFWEDTANFNVEILYDDQPWRQAKPHRLFPWGVRVLTPDGYRNLTWAKLELIRLLKPEERHRSLRLILLLDKKDRLQSQRLNWPEEPKVLRATSLGV